MSTALFDLTDRSIAALAAGLQRAHARTEGVEETLTRLGAQDRHRSRGQAVSARQDPACRHLASGLDTLRRLDKDLHIAIDDLASFLHWQRIPKHVSRPPGTFMEDYAYTQIIGPSGVYPGDDFMLGLFIIGPGQFYPDHQHAAPEFYWLFSGPSEWRFSIDGPWVRKEAGEAQWNRPFDSHAMRTSDVPLFALWAWTRDIDGDFGIHGGDGRAPLNQPERS